MKKTTYEVKPNEGKVFSEIDIKELVRVHEEEEEDSDDGADAFDSDVEEGDSEEYDTDDFSDEFTDEDDWGLYFDVENTNKVS